MMNSAPYRDTATRSANGTRHLTQLLSDNKRAYETLTQRPTSSETPLPGTDSNSDSLVAAWRLQKDRLIAWGCDWSDRAATKADHDIDGSLTQAGLSDLVADILTAIRGLLDQAEALQAQHLNADACAPSSLPPDSVADSSIRDHSLDQQRRSAQEILENLTALIDTLCALSHTEDQDLISSRADPSQAASMKDRKAAINAHGPADLSSLAADAETFRRQRPILELLPFVPSELRQSASANAAAGARPPSYESTVSSSEFRLMIHAWFKGQNHPTDVLAERGGLPEDHAINSSSSRTSIQSFMEFSQEESQAYSGILELSGWTSVSLQPAVPALLYRTPVEHRPQISAESTVQVRSLLSFLANSGDADSNNVPSLDNRFRLAFNLVSSVSRLHLANFVHGDISSNNLVFFVDQGLTNSTARIWKQSWIRKPYLTGFDLARLSSDSDPSKTTKRSHEAWMYQHPALGSDSTARYKSAHDLYSLGLVLLEIAFWMPIGKFWKSKYTFDDFRQRLLSIYLKKLSGKCGDAYMNAVRYCMVAADQLGATDQTNDFASTQREGFLEHVYKPIERCCSIELTVTRHEQDPGSDAKTLQVERSISEEKSPKPAQAEDASAQESSITAAIPEASPEPSLDSTPPVIKVWSHALPKLYSSYWASTMYPKLVKILQKAISRWESYSIDLFMAGEDEATARPTVYMECKSTQKVRRILRHLNDELRLFEIKVVSGQVVRSKANKKKRRKAGSNSKAKAAASSSAGQPSTSCDEARDTAYYERPGCGASIGAYVDDAHLPPVTYGGAVLVDGHIYGMSVHHMLENDEETEAALDNHVDLARSMASAVPHASLPHSQLRSDKAPHSDVSDYETAPDTETDSGYDGSDSETDSDTEGVVLDRNFLNRPSEPLYPFDIRDDTRPHWHDDGTDDNHAKDEGDFWLNPNWADEWTDSDDDDDCELGDTDGIAAGQGDAVYVTQPALDDVASGVLDLDSDLAAAHLDNYAFGHVYASSGLRRFHDADLAHEIDWALIKINASRLDSTPNGTCGARAAGGVGRTLPLRSPTSVLPCHDLASRSVHAHARSAGAFARGSILPAMRLVRMPGRATPSHSWQVRGHFGAGGDSGAWVFDDATGALCGHVLAFSERSGVAYIAPMDVLMQDMERTLNATVTLPQSTASSHVSEKMGTKSHEEAICAPAHLRNTPDESAPVRLISDESDGRQAQKRVDSLVEGMQGMSVRRSSHGDHSRQLEQNQHLHRLPHHDLHEHQHDSYHQSSHEHDHLSQGHAEASAFKGRAANTSKSRLHPSMTPHPPSSRHEATQSSRDIGHRSIHHDATHRTHAVPASGHEAMHIPRAGQSSEPKNSRRPSPSPSCSLRTAARSSAMTASA